MPDSVQESSERSSDAAIVVESRARNAGARNWAEPDSANAKGLNFVVGFFVVIFLSVLLQVFHLYISTPISPGSVVPPKVWLNKCGLLRFVSYCDDAFLHVEKSGNVVGYDSKKQVAWEIEGAVCKSTDKSCIPGMQFTKDLKVIVGGKPIRFVNKMGFDTPLAPWPFEAEPKLKTWLKNQKVIKK